MNNSYFKNYYNENKDTNLSIKITRNEYEEEFQLKRINRRKKSKPVKFLLATEISSNE